MIVDHGLGLVVLHVPKCAGTSLRKAFLEIERLKSNKFLFELFSGEFKNLKKINSKPIIHRLSHQKINITFWKLNVLELNDYGIKVKNLKNFPVPIILEKFFNSKANFES